MLTFALFILAVIVFFIISGSIKLMVDKLISSIKLRRKFITAVAIISCIPLAILAVGLISSGSDILVVLFALVIPFLIPAIVSGGLVGYAISYAFIKPQASQFNTVVEFNRSNYSYRNTSYSDPNVVDSTMRYVEEDPCGKIKDMMWKASNPQPKHLPSIRI